MRGHVYVIHGDITKCKADAIAFSTSTRLQHGGKLYTSFAVFEGFAAEYQALRSKTWNVGDTHWVPPTTTRPGIVVTFSIADFVADPAARAEEVVRNTIQCAVHKLRTTIPEGRLLVLLPTFLTGAGGARRMRADLARVQLRAAADTIATFPGVDVGFVLFHPADHDVFRAARREALPALFEGTLPAHKDLVTAVRARECIVFVGSGMSVPAGMPTWWRLIELLREPIKDLLPAASKAAEYLAVAQRYRDETEARGLTPLRVVVRELFRPLKSARPTIAHYLLAALEPRTLITTNYDHLLEDTYRARRRERLRVVETAEIPETGKLGHVNVVKFHGDAEHGDDVVASERDYEDFFKMRPAFALLLSGLLLNQTFLFLGYSLTDPNFRQIHDEIEQMLGAARKKAHATTFDSSNEIPGQVCITRFEGTIDEKTHELWRWLDRLVDDAITPDSLLLAEAADETHVVSDALTGIRTRLLAVAAELERVTRSPLSPDEARTAARIAATLFAHGWRSSNGNHELLKALARSLTDPTERARLLQVALWQADSEKDVQELERLLGP